MAIWEFKGRELVNCSCEYGCNCQLNARPDMGECHAVAGIKIDEIRADGEAEVRLGGRPFTIRREFLADVAAQDPDARIAALDAALLVMHSPVDRVVGIDQAAAIYARAKHPKSFIALDGADHLLTGREDAAWAASLIAAWSARYLD